MPADTHAQKKPYSAVTVTIENLTSESYGEDDLSGIPDLVDVIKLQASGPTEAARAIRKKLKYGNVHRQIPCPRPPRWTHPERGLALPARLCRRAAARAPPRMWHLGPVRPRRQEEVHGAVPGVVAVRLDAPGWRGLRASTRYNSLKNLPSTFSLTICAGTP